MHCIFKVRMYATEKISKILQLVNIPLVNYYIISFRSVWRPVILRVLANDYVRVSNTPNSV